MAKCFITVYPFGFVLRPTLTRKQPSDKGVCWFRGRQGYPKVGVKSLSGVGKWIALDMTARKAS